MNINFILPMCVLCIGSNHEQILKWWHKVSEQKPLNCQTNISNLQHVHSIVRNLTSSRKAIRVIDSRVCKHKDLGRKNFIFTFKGRTIDNRLEGKFHRILNVFKDILGLKILSFNRQIFYLMTMLRTTIFGILPKLGPMRPFWKLFRCEKYFGSQSAHMGVGPHPIFQLTL